MLTRCRWSADTGIDVPASWQTPPPGDFVNPWHTQQLLIHHRGQRHIIPAMLSRRDAIASFALFAELVASGRDLDALAQTSPAAAGTPPPPVFKHDLPNVTMDGWEVTVSYVDYPPGRASG